MWGGYHIFFLHISSGWVGGDQIVFLHISFSLVKIRLHTENELPMLSGSTLKVELGGGVVVVVQLITLSTLTTVELNKIKVVVRL